MRRVVFSLSLARLAGSSDWEQAADDLDIDGHLRKRWAKYVMGTMTSAQKNDWMACVTKCARELGAVRADPPSKRLRIRTRGDLAQAEEGLCDGQLKGLCPGPTGRLCAVPDGV